jgi:hypothetical protein
MKSAEIWSQKEYLTERKDNSGQKIDGHPSRNQWNHLWLSRPWQQKEKPNRKKGRNQTNASRDLVRKRRKMDGRRAELNWKMKDGGHWIAGRTNRTKQCFIQKQN